MGLVLLAGGTWYAKTEPKVRDQGELIAFSIDGRGEHSQLIVLKAGAEAMTPEQRAVCELPVFEAGRSSIKNTVIGYGRSVIAQNNWGAEFFEITDYEPGLVRVDVRADHSGCDLVWEENTIASQVPPRLSTADGHVYLYSRKRGTDSDVHAWYLSAIDDRTGEVVSELFVGSGKRLDSPMLSVNFWPGRVAVVGCATASSRWLTGTDPQPSLSFFQRLPNILPSMRSTKGQLPALLRGKG